MENLTKLEKELLISLKSIMEILPTSIPPIYKEDYERAKKAIKTANYKISLKK